MKRHAALVAALCLLLAGCNNLYSYRKDGADVHTTQADTMACQDKLNPLALTGDDARDAMDKCMADKGYGKQVEKYHF